MRLIRSLEYALAGFVYCCRKEANFKIHVLCTVVATAAGFALRISHIEWVFILFCIAMVLSFEMFNTAIEHLCNIVCKEKMASIKIIKDIAAGAVLSGAMVSFLIGAIVFIPKIIHLFK